MDSMDLQCDGCGQAASPDHIARRLQRLEWTTRFRPIHVGTLLLGSVSPQKDSEFMYSPAGAWDGEAKLLLSAAGIASEGKSAEATLAEFQRGGFVLAHVLECPVNEKNVSIQQLIASRLPQMLTRIRRSLKPKRLALISSNLQQFLPTLASSDLHCTILLDQGDIFALDGQASSRAAGRLHEALKAQTVQADNA
jgi:hypothetical protein